MGRLRTRNFFVSILGFTPGGKEHRCLQCSGKLIHPTSNPSVFSNFCHRRWPRSVRRRCGRMPGGRQIGVPAVSCSVDRPPRRPSGARRRAGRRHEAVPTAVSAWRFACPPCRAGRTRRPPSTCRRVPTRCARRGTGCGRVPTSFPPVLGRNRRRGSGWSRAVGQRGTESESPRQPASAAVPSPTPPQHHTAEPTPASAARRLPSPRARPSWRLG